MPTLVLGHVVVVLRISTDPTEFLSVLKHFFDISTGFRYKKNGKSSPSIYRDVHGLNDAKGIDVAQRI